MFPAPAGPVGFRRAQFLEIIASHLDTERVTTHFSKRLESYVHDDANKTVRMTFTDGSVATADVLVGCDGINSNIRYQLLETAAVGAEISGSKEGASTAEKFRNVKVPVWTGIKANRTIVPREALLKRCPNFRALSGMMLVSVHCSHRFFRV
jgi:salicylate hydroxylase